MDVPGWILGISIHALLAESDPRSPKISTLPCQFLSTLSLRRATLYTSARMSGDMISIHALLAESDSTPAGKRAGCHHFYPRSPCGERPITCCLHMRHAVISIHALLAESDKYLFVGDSYSMGISIHALLAESDLFPPFQRPKHRHFYPRSPCGERLIPLLSDCITIPISIHALLAESDRPSLHT